MRLDLFLKVSRLVYARSVAQELCDAGLDIRERFAGESFEGNKGGDKIEIKREPGYTSSRS
jgi:ribosomal 50S subunit-recycling heat shock protein